MNEKVKIKNNSGKYTEVNVSFANAIADYQGKVIESSNEELSFFDIGEEETYD
jgi:hypothetical protein